MCQLVAGCVLVGVGGCCLFLRVPCVVAALCSLCKRACGSGGFVVSWRLAIAILGWSLTNAVVWYVTYLCLVRVLPSPLSHRVFFFRHGGPPPKALHQSGPTMGKMSVHGEPKFSEGQPRVFTNQVRVKTLHELHHGPEKVKILVEAISVKDAKGYIAYTKAKKTKR